MKRLVEYVAASLSSDPAQVHVRQVERGDLVSLELSLSSHDMGRVIGKDGRVANALRQLLKVAAAKRGKRAILEIREIPTR